MSRRYYNDDKRYNEKDCDSNFNKGKHFNNIEINNNYN